MDMGWKYLAWDVCNVDKRKQINICNGWQTVERWQGLCQIYNPNSEGHMWDNLHNTGPMLDTNLSDGLLVVGGSF